jgi:hypothetical protein
MTITLRTGEDLVNRCLPLPYLRTGRVRIHKAFGSSRRENCFTERKAPGPPSPGEARHRFSACRSPAGCRGLHTPAYPSDGQPPQAPESTFSLPSPTFIALQFRRLHRPLAEQEMPACFTSTLHLHQRLATEVDAWRAADYGCEDYPAIGEILAWGRDEGTGHLRFLRKPQLRALETYWYLRLVQNTPHIFDLYQRLHPKTRELREALGLTTDAIRDFVEDNGIEGLWERIRGDDQFVRDLKLESLRETLTLKYPSYILALAMGAGKTILIGAIVATEMAMAMEYPSGPFVHNALVFAPGKTIIEFLRELAAIPYEKILPPRHHKAFAASVNLTFTRDGEEDVPVIRGSSFNVVVTNTEKIRIQKETIRKSDLGGLFPREREDEARAEVWQTFASRRSRACLISRSSQTKPITPTASPWTPSSKRC